MEDLAIKPSDNESPNFGRAQGARHEPGVVASQSWASMSPLPPAARSMRARDQDVAGETTGAKWSEKNRTPAAALELVRPDTGQLNTGDPDPLGQAAIHEATLRRDFRQVHGLLTQAHEKLLKDGQNIDKKAIKDLVLGLDQVVAVAREERKSTFWLTVLAVFTLGIGLILHLLTVREKQRVQDLAAKIERQCRSLASPPWADYPSALQLARETNRTTPGLRWEPVPPNHPSESELGRRPPALPPGTSPKVQVLYKRMMEEIAGGNCPAGLTVSDNNAVDPMVVAGGSEIFKAQADLMAGAMHEALLQSFGWDNDCEASAIILDGLKRLQERRQREARGRAPVRVRILVNAPFFALDSARERVRQDLARLKLDPRIVDVDVIVNTHDVIGAMHGKFVVVDGCRAVVTGANVASLNNRGGDFDAVFRLYGDVALALRAAFNANLGSAGYPPLPDLPAPDRLRLKGHAPVTVLFASRKANGLPFNNGDDNPQKRVFVSACNVAESTIRMWSPNLNDDAMMEALLRAMARGVTVKCILSKKYNDDTEWLYGGRNDKTIRRMLERMDEMGIRRERFAVRWWSPDGKRASEGTYDMDNPSHVKYMSVDGDFAIVGSANQDEQSHSNSEETNVVIDSRQVTQSYDMNFFEFHFSHCVPVERPTIAR